MVSRITFQESQKCISIFVCNVILCIIVLFLFASSLEAEGNWVENGITWEDGQTRIKLLRYLELCLSACVTTWGS
jgi:hypothetical protein